ncbi:uncharacterized protein LOC141692040 [Apium graveolens]|uniref:uncharacterized protein LOC141692040 n=1 Tax=Apium graveolens TaxID=4045 RepID=UPI003D793EA2
MKVFLGSQDAWEVVEEGFEEPANTTGYSVAQNKALKETRSKDKMALYTLFRAVDESGFEKIVGASNHMCGHEYLIKEMQKIEAGHVSFGDASKMEGITVSTEGSLVMAKAGSKRVMVSIPKEGNLTRPSLIADNKRLRKRNNILEAELVCMHENEKACNKAQHNETQINIKYARLEKVLEKERDVFKIWMTLGKKVHDFISDKNWKECLGDNKFTDRNINKFINNTTPVKFVGTDERGVEFVYEFGSTSKNTTEKNVEPKVPAKKNEDPKMQEKRSKNIGLLSKSQLDKKICEVTSEAPKPRSKRGRNGKQGINKANNYKYIHDAPRKVCFNCGNTNHVVIDCRKPKKKGNKKNVLVLDSGCSAHMTRTKSRLLEYEEKDGLMVSYGDGNGVTSTTSDCEPQHFRLLTDIYDTTDVVELEEELLLSRINEPVTFDQALKDEAWRAAMDIEIATIEKNHTWQLMDLPRGHKAIDLKWVFKLKRDTSGAVIKHKSRLVAKGYTQQPGIDYTEVFVPVTPLKIVRLILALAAKKEWEVHHLDVKSAFFNGVLDEEVYVSQPKGYVKPGHEAKVYKILKALYGLCQVPRVWYSQLNKCLLHLGFIKCPYEHVVYTRKAANDFLIVGVYVDDLIITGTTISAIVKFKGEMRHEFDMTDLGKLSYYLGLEVEQASGCIQIKQMTYAKKVLQKAGLSECNSVKYLMELKLQIDADKNGEDVNSTQYKSIVGGLRYLVYTRPDIAYSMGIVSRYM